MKKLLKHIVLPPLLSPEDADLYFAGKYLSRQDYDVLVDEDALGQLPDGETSCVYLRNQASAAALEADYQTLAGLAFGDVRQTLRGRALAGSAGGEAVLGWMQDKGRLGSGPRLAVNTGRYRDVYDQLLVPTGVRLSELVRHYLPTEWKAQLRQARRNGKRLIPGTKIFSTITVNRNAIFRSHTDAKNERGVACLTTFGDFTGGELCLPRLRVAFRLRPGDVLIANTNSEQHGNIGPLAGDRISTVFYLRAMNFG